MLQKSLLHWILGVLAKEAPSASRSELARRFLWLLTSRGAVVAARLDLFLFARRLLVLDFPPLPPPPLFLFRFRPFPRPPDFLEVLLSESSVKNSLIKLSTWLGYR